jgi:hypothetical protein
MLSKSNVYYTIGKVLKCKYFKWSYFLNLSLWTKSYGKKATQGLNFPTTFLLQATESFSPWPSPYKEGHLGIWHPTFFHHKF